MITLGKTMSYDLIIRGSTVFDSTGREPFISDSAITGDTIVAAGADLSYAHKVYDASGCQ